MEPNRIIDWQADLSGRLDIEQTAKGIQRHLLFTLQCGSVQTSEPTSGEFRTVVKREGDTWVGAGKSEAEALARALLAMPRIDAYARDETRA